MKKLIIASLLLLVNFAAFADENLELYTGNAAGTYYSVGQELCKVLDCKVKTSYGSIDNIDILINDDSNKKIAIVQSDVLRDAYFGLGVFSNHQQKHILPLCTLYNESYSLVVRSDSKIKSFKDLKNKIVNVGRTNSGSYHASKKMLEIYDMSLSDFKYISYLPINSQGAALCRGTIDAAIYAAGHPISSLYETASNCDIKIIPINDEITDNLIRNNPSYIKTTINANTYPGVDYRVETIGVLATLIAPSSLSNAYVYDLLKKLNTTNQKFKLIHPALHDINIDTKVPLHPGAAEFYKNNPQ